MTNIDEVPKKAFQKKEYRAWNLDEIDLLRHKEEGVNKETISNPLVNDKGADKETISNQLVNKKETKNPLGKQTPKMEAFSNPEKKTISKPIGEHSQQPIREPLVISLVNEESLLETIKRLMGLQKKILFYITEDCISRADLTSSYITNETLRNVTDTDAHTVKTSVQRLIKKNLLFRNRGKRGNGGFSSFAITLEIRNAVMEEMRQLSISKQLVTSLVNSNSKQLDNDRETHKETSPSSSSSSFKEFKNTTNTNSNTFTQTKINLPDEWLEIDFESLSDVGFSFQHIHQLAKHGQLTAEQVQESIYAFSFDLRHNNRASKIRPGYTPIDYFMGPLKKGNIYSPPSNYESPQAEALKLYNERKKQIMEREAALERETMESCADDWFNALSENEMHVLFLELSENTDFPLVSLSKDQVNNRGTIVQAELKKHFRRSIWPEKKKEIFSALTTIKRVEDEVT